MTSKHYVLILACLLTILLVLSGCSYKENHPISKVNAEEYVTLKVYCASSMTQSMTALAKKYTEETGVEFELLFNGSGMLLSQIEITETGDIYIPGEDSFLDVLKKDCGEDVIVEEQDLFNNIPVILVNKDYQVPISSLSDLSVTGIELAMGESSVAIGKLTEEILAKNNLTSVVTPNIIAKLGTVNQVATSVLTNQADAGIVFYVTYLESDHNKVYMVPIPEEENVVRKVTASVLKFSEHEAIARDFMTYIYEEGRDIYDSYQVY